MPIHTIHASGGFMRNKLWVSMLADIFQKEIMGDIEGGDASLRGAMLLAGETLAID